MKLQVFIAGALVGVSIPSVANAGAEAYDSPSGTVKIVGDYADKKSVSIGDKKISLDDYQAYLNDKVGNLILIMTSSGGFACPAMFVWLDTTPGRVGLSERFGTCSESAEVSTSGTNIRVTLPAGNGSAGFVAFDYSGGVVTEHLLGIRSSAVAKRANGDPSAWIGQSPYEYLTAAENEANLIALIGWEDLDNLRNTMVVGSQEMTDEGDWIVGDGCRPHVCNTDYAAIALHKENGDFLAAIKRDGEKPKLLGKPASALPIALRKVMVASEDR